MKRREEESKRREGLLRGPLRPSRPLRFQSFLRPGTGTTEEATETARPELGQAGFTFLELVLVVTVIGILFTISFMSLGGMTPKYRLRAAARELGATIEQTRLMAVSRGEWLGIHYVFDPPPTAEDAEPPPYYQMIGPAEYWDQPLDERPLLSKKELPTGVRFRHVLLPSNQAIQSDTWNILFSPTGNTGSHIVVLDGEAERVQTIKFNSITGLIDFYARDDVTFRTLED